VVYTSGAASLAALEFLVHLVPDQAPDDLVLIEADVPEGLRLTTLEQSDLPVDWRGYPAPATLAARGAEWLRQAQTAVLRVPSVVVPQEWNYLLNPAHPDFTRVTVATPEAFSFDPRLWLGVR
jgi:RES domain-containing protein